MTDKTGLAAVAAAADAIPRAEHDQALAGANEAATKLLDEGVAKAKAEGVKEGSGGERARVKAILTAEAAKGREAMAQYLAFDTDQPAEQAVALLDKAPKAEANKGRLAAAVPQPKVDPDEPPAPQAQAASALSASVAKELAKLGKKPLAAA